jgi:hypothetical protein
MYAGDRRPDHVFFRTTSIDGRLPSLEDPQLWLELMRRYRIADKSRTFLHLVPTDRSRELSIVPMATLTARYGEPCDLPPFPQNSLIWARIQLKPHAPAYLASQFYKPPRVLMELTVGSGQTGVARMIAENAADGFLLSPVILNNAVFAEVFDHMEIPGHLDEWRLRSIRIVGEPQSWAHTYFKPTIHIELSELSLVEAPTSAGRDRNKRSVPGQDVESN